MKAETRPTSVKLEKAMALAVQTRIQDRGNKSFVEYVTDLITADLVAAGGFDEVPAVKRAHARNKDQHVFRNAS